MLRKMSGSLRGAEQCGWHILLKFGLNWILSGGCRGPLTFKGGVKDSLSFDLKMRASAEALDHGMAFFRSAEALLPPRECGGSLPGGKVKGT
jgi:hypothetical protein